MELSRGRDAAVNSRWTELSESDATVIYPPVNVAELWAGARPEEYDALGNLFGALTCVPIDEETGRMAGVYMRRYRKSHGTELADALIAATAAANGAELWTRNRRHYPMRDVSFFE
jgi:predicted nucleic acid-binding protein